MNVTLSQFSRFAIVALMLFMQSATVVHAIEHDDSEHSEHCVAFVVTAEQLVDTPPEHRLPPIDVLGQFEWQAVQSLFVLTKKLHSLSRAPPVLI